MIVVDTNILIYRLLPGERNGEAIALVRQDAHWAAPFLWRSEMRNVLAGFMRRGQIDVTRAEELTRRAVRSLTAGEHMVDDADVFDLVSQSKCSAYDCEFVALAMALKTRLVTDDRALRHAFPRYCRSLRDAAAGT